MNIVDLWTSSSQCHMEVIIKQSWQKSLNILGSINCTKQYESSKPGDLTSQQEAKWARVWFEV